MELLSAFWTALWIGAFHMAWAFIVLWGIERLWPRGKQATFPDILRALRYWAVYLVAGTAFIMLFVAGAKGIEPLYEIPLADWLRGHWSLYIVGPLAFFALYDFFQYWMHRAQHTWFWRQHSVHHAIENLSGINGYFHWSEHLFRIAFVSLPMTFLLGMDPGGSTIVGVILSKLHGNFVHCPTRLHLGPIGKIIVDNRWHRIHHSIEPQHFDKNFGVVITLWDHLFGTAYVPAKDEWPDTGVSDQAEYRDFLDYLWPWRQDRGNASVGTVYPLSDA